MDDYLAPSPYEQLLKRWGSCNSPNLSVQGVSPYGVPISGATTYVAGADMIFTIAGDQITLTFEDFISIQKPPLEDVPLEIEVSCTLSLGRRRFTHSFKVTDRDMNHP